MVQEAIYLFLCRVQLDINSIRGEGRGDSVVCLLSILSVLSTLSFVKHSFPSFFFFCTCPFFVCVVCLFALLVLLMTDQRGFLYVKC